jgi:adenosylhomocysteine nucleosidase
MKILVTFAVHAEFAAWRKKGRFHQVTRRPFALYAADAGGSSVRVLLTGIGDEPAAEAIRWALADATDLCISSGFAGALHSDLPVAELLAARVVCRAGRELAVASDRYLFAAACDAGARPVDRFMTTRHLAVRAEDKMALSSEADAVEMESYVILAEAARRGVRAVSVRAISDLASTSLPLDFDRMRDPRGAIRYRSLIAELLRRPRQLPALLRLAKDCRMASAQLAEFLERYLDLVEAGLDRSQPAMAAAI